MRIIKPDEKNFKVMSLRDVPVGHIFKFKGSRVPMLRLGSNCRYCEFGGAWHSVEELDRELIENNTEKVKVYGKLKSVVVG